MPRTMRLEGLSELLDKQSSVVSRGQLLALGMKDTAMQYRVRVGGPWQVLLPGVYLASSARMIQGALDRGLTRPPLPIRTIPCDTPIR
jgi:hypothetical protein